MAKRLLFYFSQSRRHNDLLQAAALETIGANLSQLTLFPEHHTHEVLTVGKRFLPQLLDAIRYPHALDVAAGEPVRLDDFD